MPPPATSTQSPPSPPGALDLPPSGVPGPRAPAHRPTPKRPSTYESALCQVGVSTAEKPQNLASQPLFEYTTSALAGDRAMLASNPNTEPEAGMRDGRTPDLPSPARPNLSRHQAPNAGVRGRAPSEFASGSPSFADNLRPSALRTAVFRPIGHLLAKTSAGAFFRHGFRIHKNGLFKARTTIALTRYWTKLPELTSARGNLVFASEPTRPPPPGAGPSPPWLCPTT